MANHLHDDELIRLAHTQEEPPAHVSECLQCAGRLREFEATLRLSAAAPPTTDWNSLQAGAFLHRVRHGIQERQEPRVATWWQPALAGATLTLVAMMLLPGMMSVTPTLPSDSALNAVVDRVDGGADPQVAEDSVGLSDDELLLMIDSYLIETASEDELLLTLGDLDDADMVAALDP